MRVFDFCLAWNWEYDADFASMLNHACMKRGLRMLQAAPGNLAECLESLQKGELSFRVFLDRASDCDPAFLPFSEYAARHASRCLNPRESALRAWNKAEMHRLFREAGVLTPQTIILPSFSAHPELPAVDLNGMGGRFILKPAHGGGGEGVVTDVSSLFHIQEIRGHFPEDNYLVQRFIYPAEIEGRPGWFRGIYCAGEKYFFWWHPQSDPVYSILSKKELPDGYFDMLSNILDRISAVCGLDLFSSEIALTPEHHFIAVDYVNDPIDLRVQSRAACGVPDDIVMQITEKLADTAEAK
jgi:hypothetical protein